MEDKPNNNVMIEKAKALYYKLVKAETVERSHVKILRALPRNKKKHYLQLLASAQAKKLNALNAFQVAVKKLKPKEFEQLHKEVYL